MRVLLVTFPTASHLFPLVPLAWALRAGGHSVRVATSPPLVDHVLGAGLIAVPCGETVDTGAAWRGFDVLPGRDTDRIQHANDRRDRAMAMFTDVARAMTPDVLKFATSWRPDVIIYEPRGYAGLIAATSLDIPLVRHLWGVDCTTHRWDRERPALDGLFAEYGLTDPEPRGVLTVDPCPPSLQLTTGGSRQGMRYVPYNGPGIVPAWLRSQASRPRVCVTWGTTMRSTARDGNPLDRLVAAFAGMDVELVLAVSAHQRSTLTVPDGVRVVESMPLHLLLPSCAAIVHQGGTGTVLTAVVAGVPQPAIPAVTGAHENCGGIVQLGAAISLDTSSLDDMRRLRSALSALLTDPVHRQAAADLRREAAEQPAPVLVADRLAQMFEPRAALRQG
jgi:UDP:flavonoid glycosyltransferase YjiC (YdhE family)